MSNINKDTLVFGSFARVVGNTGCIFFNNIFKQYNINAIYKSFSVNNIEEAIQAAKILKFKGFAITMPFKKQALKYVDELSEEVTNIGATNTIINNDGILKAYNTDYMAAYEYLQRYDYKNKDLIILGNGGYSAAVQYAAILLGIEYKSITRKDWKNIPRIRKSIIYNCTPVEDIKIHSSNIFIDCLISSTSGKELSKIQAIYQFELYTGLKYKDV